MRSAPTWLGVVVLAAGACSAEPAPVDSGSFVRCSEVVDSPSLEVGSGTATLEPLTADGPIEFYPGPQGGHHVFVSLRARGLLDGTSAGLGYDDPFVSISVFTDTELSIYRNLQRSFDEDGEAIQLLGQLVRLFHPDPPMLDGEPVTLTVDVEDRCGTQVSDTIGLRLLLRAAP